MELAKAIADIEEEDGYVANIRAFQTTDGWVAVIDWVAEGYLPEPVH